MILNVKGREVLIDDDDLELVSQYRWHIGTTGYAVWRGIKDGRKQTMRMHRLIIGAPDGMIVDHINHNRLDNRRQNLRIVTPSENMRNLTDQGKGYWFHSQNLNWVVEVYGKHVGCFKTEQEAAEVVKVVRSGGTYQKPMRTHCRHGHSLTDAYRYSWGVMCKTCQSNRSREYYRRRIAS